MKNTSLFIATALILTFGFQTSLSAQRTVTWKGGTPGRCSDWNCPSNWKEGRVPDEFSNVVIPSVATSTFCYPVIRRGEMEVLSLVLHTGATLDVLDNAMIATSNLQIQGKCNGCDPRVFVKANELSVKNIAALRLALEARIGQ